MTDAEQTILTAGSGPARPPRRHRLRSLVCRSSGIIAVSMLLLLGVVAQTSAQEIVAFEDIQASPIVIEFDPSGRSAILEVDSSVDLACAVVYGVDGSFGQLAVDQDMDGGAHTNHHPVMGGLEPDTEYSYRVQGSDANGLFYQSQTMTFRTPAAPVATAANLALDAVVIEVSSEFSAAYSAAKAFDGDPTTEWSSQGDGDGAYVTVDLGSPQEIASAVFRTRSMGDGSAITDTFLMTIDGQEFGPFPAGDVPADIGVVGQIVRFDSVSTTGGNTGAVEIEILGPELPGS